MLARILAISLFVTSFAASTATGATIFVIDNTTIIVSDEGLAAATAAEAAFLAGLSGVVVTESFEGFAAGTLADSFATSVGVFSQLLAGTGGLCETVSCDGLLIDSLTSDPPYIGRFALDGTNWLDSNDSMESRWQRSDPTAPTSLGFYITDPNDQGARIDLVGADALENSFLVTDLFGSALPSGAVFYITIFDPDGLDTIEFIQTDPADGFGIDRFTIHQPGQVPEPTTLGLLGLGLLALYEGSRRKRSRS